MVADPSSFRFEQGFGFNLDQCFLICIYKIVFKGSALTKGKFGIAKTYKASVRQKLFSYV